MFKEEPIRILCVFACLDRGGAETMCMNLYRSIDRTKVQFDFVKHTQEIGAYEKEIISLGGNIFEAPNPAINRITEYCSWWRGHLSNHPEHIILHVHYFTMTGLIGLIAHRMDRIVVGHCHAFFKVRNIRSFVQKRIIRFGGHIADYAFSCSEEAGRFMYGTRKFVVLKNAINVEKFIYKTELASMVRAELNLDNCIVLGTVGTIKSVKNPMGLIEILNHVIKLHAETKLLWVGSDGGMRREAELRIQELGLENNVIFTGARSDVNRLMQSMDVFLLPSISEGLPVTIIEAQASGLPCFVSDAITEEADVTGLCHYLPLDEWNRWAEEILKENGKRKDMRTAISAAGYDIHETVEWLQQFYLSINDQA